MSQSDHEVRPADAPAPRRTSALISPPGAARRASCARQSATRRRGVGPRAAATAAACTGSVSRRDRRAWPRPSRPPIICSKSRSAALLLAPRWWRGVDLDSSSPLRPRRRRARRAARRRAAPRPRASPPRAGAVLGCRAPDRQQQRHHAVRESADRARTGGRPGRRPRGPRGRLTKQACSVQ